MWWWKMSMILKDNENPRKSSNGQPIESQEASKIMPQLAAVKATSTRCRVCLLQGKIPIFSNNNPLDFPLSHYLKLICNINITAKDIYPQYLCQSCFNTLESAITLRKTALKTQLKLKLSGFNCLKDDSQIKTRSDIMPLQKEVKKEETVEIEFNRELSLSPLETEDNEFGDQTDYNVRVSQLQMKIKHKYKEKQPIQNMDVPPILTLDQVNRLKAKEIPTGLYYEKVFTTDKKPKYQCRLCKKVYKKNSIADHLLIHLPDSVTQFVCEVCGKTFKRFCTFYQHGIIHKNILPFVCKLCPYKGRSKTLLQIHIKRVHIKAYNYQCTLCPRKFLDTNNLRYHLRRHGEPKLKCTTCGKLFYEKGPLNSHIQSQHMDLAPHKCDVCGNYYKLRKNLLAHQIKVHKRKQVYNNRATYLKLKQEESGYS